MKPRSYTSEGIVLARRNYGEADRILSIYSLQFGRVSLIAKGIRRPKSKKRGHVEVFSYISFQGSTGHGLDIMTEAEIIDDFALVRKSLKRVSLAYYFCEVTGRITHEGEENSQLFNLLLQSFEKLKTEKYLRKLRLDFVHNLLVLMGYWPAGRKLSDPDAKLEEVIERQIASVRVGKRMVQ